MLNGKSIRTQLLSSFGLLSALFVLFIAVSALLLQRVSDIREFSERFALLKSQIDEKVRLQQDFIISDMYNFEFHIQGFTQNTLEIDDLDASIDTELEQVKALFPINDLDLRPEMDSLKSLLKSHRRIFGLLLIESKKKGFKDFGLEGKMRQYAHLLEEESQEVDLQTILSLRRQEKDYLLRKEQRYIAQLEEEVNRIKQRLTARGKAESVEMAVLNNYIITFNELVNSYNAIENNAKTGYKDQIAASFKTLNQNLSNVGALVAFHEQRIVRQMKLFFFFFSVFIILLALGLSYRQAKRRSEPLEKLANWLKELEIGSIKANSKIQIEGASMELNHVVGTLNDLIGKLNSKLNELRSSQRELQLKNEELVKVNHELDRFVYSVSHDLRNPLATMLGLVELVKEERDMDEIKIYNGYIETSIKKLDEFIHDILTLSKNARLEVVYKEVNVLEIVNDIYELNRLHNENAHVDFKLDIQLKSNFYSDASRLKIIFNNLISNAFRYADYNKKYQFIKVEGDVNDKHLYIRISDNGIGIGANHLEKIYDMFYRATDDKVGSGLGLYITRESVTKLGGEIKVSSTLGLGTSFEIVIPNKVVTTENQVKSDKSLA